MTQPDLSQRAALDAGTRVTREFHHADLDLREADDGDGYTLRGLACPTNTPTTIRDMFGDFTETFAPGAFTKTLAERGHKIRLYGMHDRQSFPIGVPKLSESQRGLELEARLARTTGGEDARTLIREGLVEGLSIGFVPVQSMWNEDYTEVTRHEVMLVEVSLVPEPAYADAGVESLRAAEAEEQERAAAEAANAEARARLFADYAALYGKPVDGVRMTGIPGATLPDDPDAVEPDGDDTPTP